MSVYQVLGLLCEDNMGGVDFTDWSCCAYGFMRFLLVNLNLGAITSFWYLGFLYEDLLNGCLYNNTGITND